MTRGPALLGKNQLHGSAVRDVDDQRTLEVRGQDVIALVDDHHDLGIIDLECDDQGEWLVRTLGDVAHLGEFSKEERWG